jgi:UDP-N-acetylmuramoyl-tripeptide--D-alanyl-D-alanine ligase
VPAQARVLEPYLRRDDLVYRRFDAAEVERDGDRWRFRIDGAVVELELPFTQRHLAVNTLAALHAYAALGLPLERAAAGVPGIRLSPWRGEELLLPGGGLVVNDAYNANPDSMRAALEHLAARAQGRRRIAILGEMAELGEASERYHREIAELAAALDVLVLGVGEGARAYGPAVWAADAEEALEVARSLLRPGDAVLVKASRAVGLEGIAERIANIARAWSPS